jgi:hypothetical protein
MRNPYTILDEKPQVGRQRHKWEDNIQIERNEI